MTTIERVVADIVRMNQRGVDAFRIELDDVERAYRLYARVDAGTLELRGCADAGRVALEVENSYDDAWYGIAAARIAPGEPRAAGADEVAVDRELALAFEADVPCRTPAGEHVATVRGVFAIYIRDWGIKEMFLQPATIAVRDAAAAAALAALGLARDGDAFVARGERGVICRSHVRELGDGLAFALDRVDVVRLKRPRRDPRFTLRSRRLGNKDKLTPSIDQLRLTPEPAMDQLLVLLRDSPDAFVAAHAARLAGEHRIEAMRERLIACASDGDDDRDVRLACLWALAQLGHPDDAATMRALVERDATPDDVRNQALRVWVALDRLSASPGGFAVWAASSHSRAVVAFLARHPTVTRTVITARTRLAAPGANLRGIAIAGDRLVVAGYQQLLARRGDGALAPVTPCQPGIEGVAIASDGTIAAIEGEQLVVVAPDGGVQRHGHAGPSRMSVGIAFSPDGATVALSCGHVALWPRGASSGRLLHDDSAALAWHPDGHLHARLDDGIYRWVDVTWERVLETDCTAFAIGGDGSFALGHDDGRVELGQPGALRALDRIHAGNIWKMAFDPCAPSRLATGDLTGTIAVWQDGVASHVLAAPDTRIYGLAFGRDGLYSVSIDEAFVSRWAV